jgi:hypothetical protein
VRSLSPRHQLLPSLILVSLSLSCTSQVGGGGDDTAGSLADAGPGGANNGNNGAGGACVTDEFTAEPAALPADIIWVIDNSGSMTLEIQIVEDKLNEFVDRIGSWGIDYRIVMISRKGNGDNSVCVGAPLSDGNCGSAERFLAVDLDVDSEEGLERLIDGYNDYKGFLRDNSYKSFVAVTDDESDRSTDWFLDRITSYPEFASTPFMPMGFVFHSIVSYGDNGDKGCDTGAKQGDRYLALTNMTGGVKAPVCEDDWEPIFAALENAVVSGSQIPCVFDVPEAPGGKTLNPDELNLVHTPAGGSPTTIPNVADEASCSDQGWYYDDPGDPTQVIACPATCDALAGAGVVRLEAGCSTVTVD